MGYYDNTGQFRPGRRSQHHCSNCKRVFEYGHVPVPDHTGKRVCRDCRILQYGATKFQERNKAND